MARCFDYDMEYEIRNEGSLVTESEHLGQMQPIGDPEVEASQSLPEHMAPVRRDEDSTGEQHCSASGMLSHRQSTDRSHCHVPATSGNDSVAINQLIAISILCFVFMVAEVIGEFCFKNTQSFLTNPNPLNSPSFGKGENKTKVS